MRQHIKMSLATGSINASAMRNAYAPATASGPTPYRAGRKARAQNVLTVQAIGRAVTILGVAELLQREFVLVAAAASVSPRRATAKSGNKIDGRLHRALPEEGSRDCQKASMFNSGSDEAAVQAFAGCCEIDRHRFGFNDSPWDDLNFLTQATISIPSRAPTLSTAVPWTA